LEKFIKHIDMSKNLHLISQKIGAIGHGLLRFREGPEQQSMQVSMSVDEGAFLNCIIRDDKEDKILLNREVSLIQRNKEDYLYISGRIDDEVKTNCKIVSLHIVKACWFTRKRKGSAVWLQQKCVYENPVKEIVKAS
jgi:hypothetical protein